jgi:hypothetical protein
MAERFNDWLGAHSNELLRRINRAGEHARGDSARAAQAHSAVRVRSVELLHAMQRADRTNPAALWDAMEQLCRVHGDVEERQRAYTTQLDEIKRDITNLRTDAFKQLSDMRVPVMTCGPSHSALYTTNVRDDGRIN